MLKFSLAADFAHNQRSKEKKKRTKTRTGYIYQTYLQQITDYPVLKEPNYSISTKALAKHPHYRIFQSNHAVLLIKTAFIYIFIYFLGRCDIFQFSRSITRCAIEKNRKRDIFPSSQQNKTLNQIISGAVSHQKTSITATSIPDLYLLLGSLYYIKTVKHREAINMTKCTIKQAQV